LLFTQYLLPFEIVSVLLLVAMIGVILLSKREVQ
jgi:NADH-quinone oxidoreductase subunit J